MRLLPAILLLAYAAHTAEPPAWPLWDGQETIEQYARRAKLEPTQTLDLGNGVKLELVLIPAGKFIMGTPEPPPVDEEGFREKIVMGQAVLGLGGGALLVLLALVVTRAIRRRCRPQYSLGRLVTMTVAAGVGVLGGTHWWHSARAFSEAQADYQAALARFKDSYETEKPAHEVTLTKPYYISKFEVTQEQYQQVVGNNPSHFRGRDLSVEQVSWDDAQDFCKKASEVARSSRDQRGDPASRPRIIRLPTEAEWEHACRAGTKTTYYTGDAETDLDRAAWYSENSNNTTHPLGQKAPNAWGVHDMHGNVCEWCADWFETYKAEAVVDPQGPAQGEHRVLRGGSWYGHPRLCRYRFGGGPDVRNNLIGFRVVVDVPKTP